MDETSQMHWAVRQLAANRVRAEYARRSETTLTPSPTASADAELFEHFSARGFVARARREWPALFASRKAR